MPAATTAVFVQKAASKGSNPRMSIAASSPDVRTPRSQVRRSVRKKVKPKPTTKNEFARYFSTP